MMATALSSGRHPGVATTVFRWDSPHRRRWGLAIFIAASVALHAICFYLFQITYPPTVALLPPPARVNLITPATEEGRVLLRWVEAEDPALASTTQRAPDAKSFALPKVAHIPSYLATKPVLRDLPRTETKPALPSSDPPRPVQRQRPPPPPVPLKSPTVVNFSPELAGLGQPQWPTVRFTAATNEAAETAEFRVAVSGEGIIRFCFLQHSSGDAALDEQARNYIVSCRFTAAARTAGLVWGQATIEWGNDVAPPAPPDAGKHTP